MLAPFDRTKPLPFHQLGAPKLQRLCSALFAELPNVQEARVYGINGQSQRGIDVEVTLADGNRWVAQVKACEINETKHLLEAVREFLPHANYWKFFGAERFIVILGCAAEKTQTLDALRELEIELSAAGYTLELWDSYTLRRKLRTMPKVVENFLEHWWVEEICGTGMHLQTVSTSANQQLVPSALLAELGDRHGEQLDKIRDTIRSGDELEAERQLRSLLGSQSWQFLPAPVRSRVFRLLCAIAINRGDELGTAEAHLVRAKEIEPNGRFVVLETVLRHHREGVERALAEMSEATNLDEWNLRAALLLNAGRSEEAISFLKASPFPVDAEHHRLAALGWLHKKDVREARSAALRAQQIAPHWVAVKEALALVEYFTAISPAFPGWHQWTWPMPVPLQYVRTNPESCRALAAAAELFGEVTKQKAASPQRECLQAWHLASIANDSSRQLEAATLARSILASTPASIPAAIWAISRNLDFDQSSTVAALEQLCINPTDPDPVQALFILLASNRQYERAGLLLDRHQDLYKRFDMWDSWCFQRSQLYAVRNLPDDAERTLQQHTQIHDINDSRAVVARLTSLEYGWTEEALNVIKEEALRSGTDHAFYAACEAHHLAGQHRYVVDRAEELISRIQTETAVRVTLESAAAAREFQLCLDLIDRHRSLFRSMELPPVIVQLKAKCLMELARFDEAEIVLSSLPRQQSATIHRFGLFQAQFITGKIREASTTARFLLEDPSLTAEGLLHIAQRLTPEDPDLARTFLIKAILQGVQSAEGAALGIQVGTHLGMQEKVVHLFGKLAAAADQPDSHIRALTNEEIEELTRASLLSRQEIYLKYQRGHVPLHHYTSVSEQTLASLFHEVAEENQFSERPLSVLATLEIRHGSRNVPEHLEGPNPRTLFLHITSLFLAAHLEILQLLEDHFAPIQISPWVMESINQQIFLLSRSEASGVSRTVVDLFDSKRLHEISTSSDQKGAQAPQETQWTIALLPVLDSTPVDELTSRTSGLGDLMDFLSFHQYAPADKIQSARAQLGALESVRILPPNTFSLILTAEVARLLGEVDLLHVIVHHLHVSIPAECLNEHRAILARIEKDNKLIKWLRSLRNRLRDGLNIASYVTVPNPAGSHSKLIGPDVCCLHDYLNVQRSSTTVSCCEDRHLTRFRKIGQSPTCSLFDILYHLHRKQKLSSQHLFSHICLLRASNARYLPLTDEELCHWLLSAPVTDAVLRETTELATIRRYFASCVLTWTLLQVATAPEDMHLSEFVFVQRIDIVILRTLSRVWNTPHFKERREAASNWLLECLWFDTSALPSLAGLENNEETGLAAISIVQLIFHAFSVGKSEMQPYLDWLLGAIAAHPPQQQPLALPLRKFITDFVREETRVTERKIAVVGMKVLISALPTFLREQLAFNKAERKLLNLEERHVVAFGNTHFEENSVWRAAASASKGTPTVVQDQIKRSFKLSRDATNRNILQFTPAPPTAHSGWPTLCSRNSIATPHSAYPPCRSLGACSILARPELPHCCQASHTPSGSTLECAVQSTYSRPRTPIICWRFKIA